MTSGDMVDPPARHALELSDISKSYGNTVALDRATLSCGTGEIHGLLGENGAGKSTLVKILSGLIEPDRGDIKVAGHPVVIRSPDEARDAGIATAFQELTLVPHMTVAQNLFLGREVRNRLRLISPVATSESAARVLDEWSAGDIDPDAPVSALSLSDRQRLEVVRALSRRTRIALLDEATAALGAAEVDWLFAQVTAFRASGGTIIYISHRMGEVRQLCDRCTVLRDGRDVATFATAERTDAEVVDLMAGREVQQSYAVGNSNAEPGEAALDVEHLASGTAVRDISLTLHRGEILGVAGLHGHGQKELFMALFGAIPSSGTIRVGSRQVRLRSPHDAVSAGIGISLVPEERKSEGLMTTMPGLLNLTLPTLPRFSTAGFVRRNRERAAAAQTLRTVNASFRALDREVWTLSGGNQQKIVIGKWLMAGARILLMYDPTRGVDVQTKAEIFALMRRMTEEGRSILFYSTEVEELANVADRILIIYRGAVTAELDRGAATMESIVEAMLGEPTEAST